MKNFLLVICYIVSFQAVTAQSSNQVVIGKIVNLPSAILHEDRKVWVYVPNGDTLSATTTHRYPVVYLLDGDAHFASVTGMIEQLSSVNGNTVCPEMIVVGLPNTDRTRDLTPTHVAEGKPFLDSAFAKTSGGGEAFLSFMEKELMPYIDAHYPTAPYKTLIGHSFGGLLVMHTLLHHPALFNSYIAIDPSMWWDKQRLLHETPKLLSSPSFKDKTLFLGIANTMEDGMTINRVRKDTTPTMIHIRSLLTLQDYLAKDKTSGLRSASKYYPGDSHGSVPLITEYDALHFIFDYYPLHLTSKDYEDTTTALPEKYEKHFVNISERMGYKALPAEDLMNRSGYNALNEKRYKKAERFFLMNVGYYPKSANVYDSLGDYYATVGDTAKAISNYEKTLALFDNPDTRAKLEQLRKK